MKRIFFFLLFVLCFFNCKTPQSATGNKTGNAPFLWENANVYFLLTDRFNNGDSKNDVNFGRTAKTATLRGFMGGDIKGITMKIEEGYFDKLGITAIWFTPVVEQIHGSVDEGTGLTYGFHGYWTKDWTRLDPNFGTEKDLAELVKKAHQHGIRIVLDVVINHTGPVTEQDPLWSGWARTEPQCTYKDYDSTVGCTLVKNLPDTKTESNEPVNLPPFLVEKWKREGRYKKEIAELDGFFKRTGYPRAPRFYIIKWLTDYIREYGVDGYRCDTAKHIEESVWAELRKEADLAFADWKKANPGEVLDNNEFYMTGEVSGYTVAGGRMYDFGDRKVDYFNYGYSSLINFGFKNDAQAPTYEALFSRYSVLLQNQLRNKSVLNYLDSHDDGEPFDKERKKPMETGIKLLLCPGASQVYYGDETNRSLLIPGTQGDATLRSFMNWDELAANAERNGYRTQDVLAHWQKLGRFRQAHPAVGAGFHKMLSEKPYLFKRTFVSDLFSDTVVVGLDWPQGKKEVDVRGIFTDGALLTDYYSGQQVTVTAGKVTIDSQFGIVLLGK
ncbi:MAG TPA: alpha-amylase family glycosyl hydrolase [Saprospiraceae bacterium]|nr:alpha-amylase family glycosyl hydrolase [Saprospiraceae bacterium]